MLDRDGKVTGWCGTNIDIEDRKRVEDDLARSKEILDETQRMTQCGSMGFNVSTGEVFWSAEGARIFFAGDTAYAPFFHDVKRRLGPIDLALLPIGAYEPRWFMHGLFA